jgi:hypothetical protein
MVSLYYDIDDILGTDERIRVEFAFGAINLGYLSSGEVSLIHIYLLLQTKTNIVFKNKHFFMD